MRTNGYIYILEISDGGLNEYGEPATPDTEWSDAIPCSIEKNSDTSLGVYQDGNFRQVHATVLVEASVIRSRGRVKLEMFDDDLGEFDILSVTSMPGMGRVKIQV